MATAGSNATLTRLALALVLFLSACGTFVPWQEYRLGRDNQARVNRIHIGQTLAEVEKVMGHGPERRSTRLRYDGLSIEEWAYVTDYVHRTDTTITFVGGKVEEIRAVPWGEKD